MSGVTLEILGDEWDTYRRACDRVDLLRYDPSFDNGANLTDRLATAETLAEFLDDAIAASNQLVSAGERQPEIDQEWLDELRERHGDLQDYTDTTQGLINETEDRLRRTR